MAATDLYEACLALLGACFDGLELSGNGAPARAYVSPGPPAWDCEQLTVYAGGPSLGDTAPLQPPLQPGHRAADGRALNLVSLTATILRCAPVPEQRGQTSLLPSATDMDACAQVILSDCWAIWSHVATLKRQDKLFPGKTRELFFDPAVALSAAGALVGWQLGFRVELGGYRTVAP